VRPFLLLLAPLLAGCEPARDTATERLTRTGELVALSGGGGGAGNACFTCHGLEGQGDGVASPRLAGLPRGYLQKQMEDYASGRRPHDVMGPIASALDSDSRRAVAWFYADMAAPAPASGTRAPAGPPPEVYFRADPARGLPACATCHGPAGQGGGAGLPPITGQPAAYTADQLRRWQRGERRNDPRGVMQRAAAALSEPEIEALAAWLAAAPTAPAPASVSASESASASAGARPAASRETRRPGPQSGA
jgi:cytochrome c553